MERTSANGSRGFTLIEALAVLGIVSMLVSIGLPRFNAMIAHQRAEAALYLMSSSLASARLHAITHAVPTTLCPGDGRGQCRSDSDWSGGWILFESRDNAKQPASADAILQNDGVPLRGGLRFVSTSGRKSVRFTPDGRSAGSNASFTLCKGDTALGQVVVNNAGRARSEKPGDSRYCRA